MDNFTDTLASLFGAASTKKTEKKKAQAAPIQEQPAPDVVPAPAKLTAPAPKGKLALLINNPGCIFIGDAAKRQFHKKDCKSILSVREADLMVCGDSPDLQGLKPCPICRPQSMSQMKYEDAQHTAHTKIKREDKALMYQQGRLVVRSMGKTLVEKAIEYGMKAELKGTVMYITTGAGEWYFDYTNRPIPLHHKNNFQMENNPARNATYHLQKQTFQSPVEVIAYIHRHDNVLAFLNRLNVEFLQVKTGVSGNGLVVPMLNGREIRAGQYLEVLTPTGLHTYEVCHRFGDDVFADWYLKDTDLSVFGLFCQLREAKKEEEGESENADAGEA